MRQAGRGAAVARRDPGRCDERGRGPRRGATAPRDGGGGGRGMATGGRVETLGLRLARAQAGGRGMARQYGRVLSTQDGIAAEGVLRGSGPRRGPALAPEEPLAGRECHHSVERVTLISLAMMFQKKSSLSM